MTSAIFGILSVIAGIATYILTSRSNYLSGAAIAMLIIGGWCSFFLFLGAVTAIFIPLLGVILAVVAVLPILLITLL